MKRVFTGLMAIGFMLCLAFYALATDSTTATQGTTTQGTVIGQGKIKNKIVAELQQKITDQQSKIDNQQKLIVDLKNSSAKQFKIDKEEKKLTFMNNKLSDLQAKLAKLQGSSVPATPVNTTSTTTSPAAQKQ